MKASEVRSAVAGVLFEVAPLNSGLDSGIDGRDGSSLSSTLYAVERSINALKQARQAILRHERDRGASWAEISDATGVPSSTWRNRYNRGAAEA